MSMFRFAAAGDAIITKRVSQKNDPGFLEMVELIRGADAAFVNLEVVTPRKPLIPSSEHGGANLGVGEFVLDELAWMGFNLFNVATNHSNDFTFHGIVDTMNALSERNLTFAGGGMNLGEARSPGYYDTSDARVAVLGATSSFVVGGPAGPSREDMPGRPGVSPLRVTYRCVLDSNRWNALKDIHQALGLEETLRQRAKVSIVAQKDHGVNLFGTRFVQGERCAIQEEVIRKDLDDICRWIDDAKRQAEFVVMSLHAHQGPNGSGNNQELAEFLPDVCRRFIDSGADVVVGHGPHMLRAVEVYKGKPIFYSLGDFYYVSSGIRRYPAEIYEMHGLPATATPADVQDKSNTDEMGNPRGFAADERFWQSIIPICEYRDWKLASLKLHPIDLNYNAAHRTKRGEPKLASFEAGVDILRQLQRLSEPFGTHVEISQEGARAVGAIVLR